MLQVALLLSISAVYELLIDVLPVVEVTKLAVSLLDSLPRELPAQLVQAKLIAIKNLVTSKLFQDDGMLLLKFIFIHCYLINSRFKKYVISKCL